MSEPVDQQAIRRDAEATILAKPHRAAVARAHDCLTLLAELEQTGQDVAMCSTANADLEERLAQAETDRDEARNLAGHWNRKLNETVQTARQAWRET